MQSLETIKNSLASFFRDKPIIKAWIFGSYARGEATPDSDIDILVDFDMENYPSLLKHTGYILELENILGVKIDLVPNDSLYNFIRNSIEHEKILIYERN